MTWGRRPGRSEPPGCLRHQPAGLLIPRLRLPRAAPEVRASRMCGGRERLPEVGALGPELPAWAAGGCRNRCAPRRLCPRPSAPLPAPRPGHWPCGRLPGALGPPVPGASAPLAPHPAAPGPAGSRLPAWRVCAPVLGPEGESGGPRAPRPGPRSRRPDPVPERQPRRPGRSPRSAGDTWCPHLPPRARGLRPPSPQRGAHGQLVSPLALVSFPSSPSPSVRAFSVLPGVALRSRAGRTRRPPWARVRGQSLTFLLSPGIRPHTEASPSACAASFPRPSVPSRVPHGAWVTPSCPSLRTLQAPWSAALGLPSPHELQSEPAALVLLLGSLLPRRRDSGKKELCLLAPPVRSDKARARERLPVATDTPTSWLVMSGVPCMVFNLQATPHYAPRTTTSERENSGPCSYRGLGRDLDLSWFCLASVLSSRRPHSPAPRRPTSPTRSPAAVTSQHRTPRTPS